MINIITNPSEKGKGVEISGKALGILFYCLITDGPISASAIARALREGEKAISTGLRELRQLEYLELRREKFNGRFYTSTFITGQGYKFIGEFLAKISESKHLVELVYGMNRVPKAARALPRRTEGPRDNFNISIVNSQGFLCPSDLELEKIKKETEDEVKKILEEERVQGKQASATQLNKSSKRRKFIPREDKELKDWTASDVTFEFDDRIKAFWYLKPSGVVTSKMTPALSAARKKNSTNGEIEVLMMDRFFETTKVKEYADANALWKMFISRFSELRQFVETTRLRTGDMERAIEQAEEQWAKEFPSMHSEGLELEIYDAHEQAMRENEERKKLRITELKNRELTELSNIEDEFIAAGKISNVEYTECIRQIRLKYTQLKENI